MNDADAANAADAHAAWRCQETVTRFSCHFDAGEYLEMERYFTEDGVWRRMEGDIHGLPALRKFLAARGHATLTRHLLSNLRVTLAPGRDSAVVDSYVTAYRHAATEGAKAPAPLGPPLLIGRYRDRLLRVAGEWKIAQRELQVDFRSGG